MKCCCCHRRGLQLGLLSSSMIGRVESASPYGENIYPYFDCSAFRTQYVFHDLWRSGTDVRFQFRHKIWIVSSFFSFEEGLAAGKKLQLPLLSILLLYCYKE